MEISKEQIDTIKRSNDLVSVIKSQGVKLRKKGSNYVGLCPFHKEKTPSFTVNPKTNLYNCFGCKAGGDVIGFLCEIEGIGFREAVERLSNKKSTKCKVQSKKHSTQNFEPGTQNSSVNNTHILNRVVSFYYKSFCEDKRAMEYLQLRGITDNSIFTDFQIGYSNGTLLNTTADEGEVYEALKEIGILNDKGNEMFYGCTVFPVFDENKDCVGLYGRRITEGATDHLYLPGPRKGVFNHYAAKRSKTIILTESIIDALTLYNAGFKDVIPCYGVNGLIEDHIDLFKRYGIKEIYICFDNDDAGKLGAENIAEQLKEENITSYIVTLPESSDDKTDINSFFHKNKEAPVIFERLLKNTNPRTAVRSDRVIKEEINHYEKTDTGFSIQYGERRYEVKGITREGVKLKATIKAAHDKRFHLDTVDLYSNRSRLYYAKACSVLYAEEEQIITEDMTRLIELCESWKHDASDNAPDKKMTKTEEDDALEFLKDPLFFNRLLDDFETIGLTGEEANKLMGYIAATSRKLDEPLSVLIQSRSAAGKSTLQDAVISLIPDEDYVKYTRLTGQALFYKEEDSLINKLLAIEEEQGAKEASYSIRNIQSSKCLSIAATGKDPVSGKLRTEEYKVKGPVALMITTTEAELDYETSNRFITLTIDESKEMTEKILQKQRQQDTLEGLVKKAKTEHITKRHHNAQRLLRPLHVVNPYAEQLSFPAESLRARRDHKKYLGLIKAIAFIHQYQREIKTIGNNGTTVQYIEATIEDIAQANKLAGEILGRTLDELSPPSRLLLKMIREMVEARGKGQKQYCFTRKDIRDWSQWSDFQIKTHIRQLEDLEYIYSATGKKGKEYIYELLYEGGGDDGKPFMIGLTDVRQLKKKIKK